MADDVMCENSKQGNDDRCSEGAGERKKENAKKSMVSRRCGGSSLVSFFAGSTWKFEGERRAAQNLKKP